MISDKSGKGFGEDHQTCEAPNLIPFTITYHLLLFTFLERRTRCRAEWRVAGHEVRDRIPVVAVFLQSESMIDRALPAR